MVTSREPSEISPLYRGSFFKDHPLASEIMSIQQLFNRSCTALCCAQLFALVLLDKNPNLKINDLIKIVRLFEIGIYAEIWKDRWDEADEKKSTDYINTYLSHPPNIISDVKEIELLTPRKDGFLFVIIVNSDNLPHTLLLSENANHFIFDNITYNHLTELNAQIIKVFRIDKNHIKLDVINAYYRIYKRNITRSLSDYHEDDNLTQYYVECFKKWDVYLYQYVSPILNIYSSSLINYFPELRTNIEKQLQNHPEKLIFNLVEVGQIIKLFPDCRKSMITLLTNNPDRFFCSFADFHNALHYLPEYESQIKKLYLLDMEKYLRSLFDLHLALNAFAKSPDHIKKIDSLFVSNLKFYIKDLKDAESSLKIFKDYSSLIHEYISNESEHFLQSDEDIQKFERLFSNCGVTIKRSYGYLV